MSITDVSIDSLSIFSHGGENMKVVSLIGARPQFIKEAALSNAVRQATPWEHIVVHSGQHYDADMSDVFFQELGIIQPQYFLHVGSGSHAAMTAAAMIAFEKVVLKEKPDIVLIYGDTNTTLAGALVAAKLKIPIAHIEAGLRQDITGMPEEINRQLCDRISSWLFCCSQLGVENLLHEGQSSGVVLAGDIMYDLFVKMKPRFRSTEQHSLGLADNRYAVITLHRDFNVDSPHKLRSILKGIDSLCARLSITPVLPIHPRTLKRIDEFNLKDLIDHWQLTQPLGYLELMGLIQNCFCVISDSGGLQKEAYYLGKRCGVMMENTSWKELTDIGWNILLDFSTSSSEQYAEAFSQSVSYVPDIYGTGNAAQIIIKTLTGVRNG